MCTVCRVTVVARWCAEVHWSELHRGDRPSATHRSRLCTLVSASSVLGSMPTNRLTTVRRDMESSLVTGFLVCRTITTLLEASADKFALKQ